MSSFRISFLLLLIAVMPTGGSRLPERAAWLDLPFSPRPYPLERPSGFVPMAQAPDNPLSLEGVSLGRRLFFDPILSADSSLSCAGCHRPEFAFADTLPLSRGVGGSGSRNVPSLINVGFYTAGLFWDGRVSTLEQQALHPVENPQEMGNDWKQVEERLRRHAEYPALFRQAFGIRAPAEIDRRLVGKALAQFQRTLIHHDSKFDRVARGEEQFTIAERRGWEVFFDFPGGLPTGECGHCHTDPLFTDLQFHNNGLDVEGRPGADRGRGAVSGRGSDFGKFRTPGLRNIALTAPYMHDGRFRTLEEVIDHYNSGGHYGENVNPNVRPLRLSEADKQNLIAFLHTLTDRRLQPSGP